MERRKVTAIIRSSSLKQVEDRLQGLGAKGLEEGMAQNQEIRGPEDQVAGQKELIAFADREDARRAQEEEGGILQTFGELTKDTNLVSAE